MNFLDIIKTRRSIRKYIQKPIPDEIINQILDCARYAPTANNKQPWLFIVIKNNDLKTQIAELTDYGKFIKEAYCCIAVFCEDTKYYLEDGSAATQNILLAAWSFGIGSCWIAGDKKFYAEKIKELLSLEAKYKLVSLISLGYPEENELKLAQKINKKELKDIVKFYE
ncbi:MAG: nitroreductase family protein [Endomicrobia bacterium]|nr:nitroreductase family protein [Endomicrobiia bacterium]